MEAALSAANDAITTIETQLAPWLAAPLPAVVAGLAPLDVARVNAVLAFAVTSLLYSELHAASPLPSSSNPLASHRPTKTAQCTCGAADRTSLVTP